MAGATLERPLADDRLFIRNLITVMAIILISGFAVQFATGRSSFNAPLVVHLHAAVFMGWVAITLMQTWLAAGGNISLHRQLGKLSLAWVVALLIVGPLVTVANIQSARTPFFFQPQHFLIANPMTMVGFVGLFGAALVLRRQTDWHARLQAGAFVMLMGPGFGRLLPMPMLPPYAFEIAGLVALVFPLVGIIRDWRVHGRPHAAWLWTVAALVGVLVLARVIAFSPIGEALYATVAAGTQANADGLAYPPPPPMPPT